MSNPPPPSENLSVWAEQVTRYLKKTAARLRWKLSGDSAAENGVILWDEATKSVVVSVDGKWEDLSTMTKSAFGDSISTNLVERLSMSATYGLLDNLEQLTASGGSITTDGGEFVLNTGTSVGGYAVLWSHRPLVYTPGFGAETRITGRFDTPVASSMQAVGMFSAINGMFAGYNGTSFGFMHRHGGEIEIRRLTISAASGSSATATVTLNGTAYTASVTATTAAGNAEEIAAGLRAGAAATAWNIQAVGSTVVFQYRGAGAQSGTYSLSVSAGTLAGTFAQVSAGATPTETWYPQADWSIDTCSWLDPSKGNIYKFEYAYLGYGPLKFSVFDPAGRNFKLAHCVDWTNANTSVNFSNPSMRPGWIAASLGSTTDLTVAGGSALALTQGDGGRWRPFGRAATRSSVTTEVPILSIQSRYHFGSRAASTIGRVRKLSISTDSTKGAIFRVYVNATLGGTPQWAYEDEDQSTMLYDSAASTVSGTSLGTYVVGPSGSEVIDISGLEIDLTAGDTFTVSAERVSGAATEMTVSLSWGERV